MAKTKFEVRRFDSGEKQQIESLLQQLKAIIQRRTRTMSTDDRRRFGCVDERNKRLLEKVLQLSKSHPDLSSPRVDWAVYEEEYKERDYVEQILGQLETLMYDLGNTKIALDNNNYNAALLDYAHSQILEEEGEVDITYKIREISQFFPGRPKKTDDKDDTKGDEDAKDSESTTEEKK